MAKMTSLTEALDLSNTDILHLRTAGGIDKRITGCNARGFFVPKGAMSIALTNSDSQNHSEPAIAAGGFCEINGKGYYNDSEIAITGTTTAPTWWDIMLTPSGTSYTASFVARHTGVWSDSKQGLYNGGNRIVGCVYRGATSPAEWWDKNILIINNLMTEIHLELPAWDMDLNTVVTRRHGLNILNIVSADVYIRNDAGDTVYTVGRNETISGDAQNVLWITAINASYIYVNRSDSSSLDSTNFNDTGIKRGRAIIKYRVN